MAAAIGSMVRSAKGMFLEKARREETDNDYLCHTKYAASELKNDERSLHDEPVRNSLS